MWTHLTQPFTFTLPGFRTSELKPWDEAGQRWRRLGVVWPSDLGFPPGIASSRAPPDGHSLAEPLIVSIDVSEINFR